MAAVGGGCVWWGRGLVAVGLWRGGGLWLCDVEHCSCCRVDGGVCDYGRDIGRCGEVVGVDLEVEEEVGFWTWRPGGGLGGVVGTVVGFETPGAVDLEDGDRAAEIRRGVWGGGWSEPVGVG